MAMAKTSLPRIFLLQTFTRAYMTTVVDHPQFQPSGVLRFHEYEAFSPRVKFAAEQSKTGDGTLVHIRSCFNNKYCVPVPYEFEQGLFMIVACANKPQEDATDPGCTLFRVSTHNHPTSEGDSIGFRLFSISRSQYVLDYHSGFSVNHKYNFSENIFVYTFQVVDWEKLVILPSQVSFKSAEDGKYLCSRPGDGGNYHYFESGWDIESREVGYELIPVDNGNYRIKSLQNGKYLRGVPQWIVADTYAHTDETLFSFIKISDKVVALSCLGNKTFCGGYGNSNCLRACYPELTKQTWLIVEQRVLRREISNVRYRLEDSMIHDEEIQVVSNEFATNASTDKDDTATLYFSQTNFTTTSWNNSLSLSVGRSVSVGFQVSMAPFSFKSQVKISTKFGTSHQWGETNTNRHKITTTYKVPVPKSTSIKVSLMVAKGVCEVPFNYTETVLLPNGEWVTKEKDDGIYKGIKTSSFYFNSSKVDYNPSLGKVIGN